MDDIHILWNDTITFFTVHLRIIHILFHQQGQEANWNILFPIQIF